jgi:hypothetical protein
MLEMSGELAPDLVDVLAGLALGPAGGMLELELAAAAALLEASAEEAEAKDAEPYMLEQ